MGGFWARVCGVELSSLFYEGEGVCAGAEADLISWIYYLSTGTRVEWIVRGDTYGWRLRVVGIVDWLGQCGLVAVVTL